VLQLHSATQTHLVDVDGDVDVLVENDVDVEVLV